MKAGNFGVHSYHEALRGVIGANFDWRSIQGAKITRKVAFFAWTAALDRIITVHNLQKHKKKLIIDWYFMCENSRESVKRVLLHCMMARNIWSFV